MEYEKDTYFYLRTIKHISRVYYNVAYFIEYATDIIQNYKINIHLLLENTFNHDRVKFKYPEYPAYVELTWNHYLKNKKGINNYPLNKLMTTNAVIHHLISSPHHPEYWDNEFLTKQKFIIDEETNLPKIPINGKRMPNECIVEMVCDWKAVADEMGNTVREWADKTVNKRWIFTPVQVNLIYDTISFFETSTI